MGKGRGGGYMIKSLGITPLPICLKLDAYMRRLPVTDLIREDASL